MLWPWTPDHTCKFGEGFLGGVPRSAGENWRDILCNATDNSHTLQWILKKKFKKMSQCIGDGVDENRDPGFSLQRTSPCLNSTPDADVMPMKVVEFPNSCKYCGFERLAKCSNSFWICRKKMICSNSCSKLQLPPPTPLPQKRKKNLNKRSQIKLWSYYRVCSNAHTLDWEHGGMW